LLFRMAEHSLCSPLPWTCPACSLAIRHAENEPAPRPNIAYRCDICRLELILDKTTNKLVLAPFPERTKDVPITIWATCPKCQQKAGVPMHMTVAPHMIDFECEVCGHVWRIPDPANPPKTPPERP